MIAYWVFWIVLGVLVDVRADQCRINPESSFTVVVASHRNATGHWILTVDSKRAVPESTQGGVTIETTQISSSCGGDSELIQLMATASVEPPKKVSDSSPATATDTSISIAPDSGNFSEVSTQKPNAEPIDDYEGIPGLGYYKVHTEKLSWEKAKETCLREGAHLMVINSDVEAEIFKSLHKHHRDAIESTGWNNVQMGVHDPNNNGNFVTIHGDPINSTQWYQGKPSTSRGYCGTALHNSLLYNWDCNSQLAFVCERPAI